MIAFGRQDTAVEEMLRYVIGKAHAELGVGNAALRYWKRGYEHCGNIHSLTQSVATG